MMFLKNMKVATFYGKRIILSQNSLLKTPKRNGYLILVPEIGEDLPGKYPLLKEDRTPEFTNVTIEKCVAVIGRQTLELEEKVKSLAKDIENVNDISPENLFKNVLDPLEDMSNSLSITWGIAKTLYVGNQSVMPTQCYITIDRRAKRADAFKYVSKPIYQACKNVLNNSENKLTVEQRRVLTKYVLEGKLNALELSGKKSQQFTALKLWLLETLEKYSQKVEVATNNLSFILRDPADVRGFPEDLLKALAQDSTQYLTGPWIIRLTPNIVEPLLEYCPNRTFRWKIWDTNVIKASLLHDKSVQTSTTLEDIRQKRNQEAELLGYKSFVDLSIETKMATSVQEIYNVFNNLLATARPVQEYEIKELQMFASEEGLEGELQHWDIAFWGRQHLRSIHGYKEEDFTNYFSLPQVLNSLFELTEILFDVKIMEAKKPDVWHKDVQFFDVFDLKQSTTDPIANFYLDLYARGYEKVRVSQDTGYIVPIQHRSKISDIKPLIALIFNFQPPIGAKPSLLSFKDLQTLFRKFGHLLPYILTKAECSLIAGLSFVEWDAAFICDHFFENWLYEPLFLQKISCHQDTGESLSPDMIEKLIKAKMNLSGYNLCKELYLSQFDLELYSGKEFWNNIMGRLWKKYFVLPAYKRDCHICSFVPIFSGSWPAAYYSNIWSKMIAADLYSVFQNVSYKDKTSLKELGSRYRESFLCRSGIYPARENFRKFVGRDPNPKALLKNLRLDIKYNMLKINSETNQEI
ncbi:Oligopeptidase A [Eufriesea mexicana]|uniref:oligopeptidase A n=1 Tax=Eufriesea mexicana TaxID=516756 RepID=A0A310S737_9HYME|nr:PREDICTED: probable cytosolic oligopeptidase A [Eufriesea mexicana]OAD52206.1 Oligopeptidase A [Eufriesea mexicana]